MPRHWYDPCDLDGIDARIVASKKPYFMKYIYPDLAKAHSAYIKSTSRKCLMLYQLSIDELRALPSLDESQQTFLKYLDMIAPTDNSPCVINKICWRFENEFDCYLSKHAHNLDFDYSIMKSETPYSQNHKREITKLYKEYLKDTIDFSIQSNMRRIRKEESAIQLRAKNAQFRVECSKVCPNKDALCNIILDICYPKSSSKLFAWSMCGSDIVENLLQNNGRTISYPTLDPTGSIQYGGQRFRIDQYREEDLLDDYFE